MAKQYFGLMACLNLFLTGCAADVVENRSAVSESEIGTETKDREGPPGLAGQPSGNPVLIQSRFGQQGNFELIVPSAEKGFEAYWRDNDDGSYPWRGPYSFGQELGQVDAISFIENRNGDVEGGALELVARTADRLHFYWRSGPSSLTWNGPSFIGLGAAGTPSLIQSDFGANGNFELAVPSNEGGVDMYWRDNDNVQSPKWFGPYRLAPELGAVDAVALIQAHDAKGTLHLVARVGMDIFHLSRSAEGAWTTPLRVCGEAHGTLSLTETDTLDLELTAPSVWGGIDHYAYSESTGWGARIHLRHGLNVVDAVSVVQTNFNRPRAGNLDMVIRAGDELFVAYRQDGTWSQAIPLASPMDPPQVGGASPLVRGETTLLGSLLSAPGMGGVNDLGEYGMSGTDLGASFEFDGKVAFLFGDTWSQAHPEDQDLDSIAVSSAPDVSRFEMPKLDFIRRPGSRRFSPISAVEYRNGLVAPIANRGMNVPVEGFAIGNRVYAFFATNYYEMTAPTASQPHRKLGYYERAAILAHRDGLGGTDFIVDYEAPSERFINVSVVQKGDALYIYGAGNPYRNSAIYLARVATADIADPSKWRFFQGTRDGLAVYSPWESAAQAVVPLDCAGEFNVRKNEASGLYLMTYNCGSPSRGIQLRTAPNPWGPWSDPQTIFDVDHEGTDPAYGLTMHKNRTRWAPDQGCSGVDYDDGLADEYRVDAATCADDPHGGDRWGGEYGPYMVPRWSRTRSDGTHTIVWLLSTWNPYRVSLMETVLGDAAHPPQPSRPGDGLPIAHVINGTFEGDLRGWDQPLGTQHVQVTPMTIGFGVVPGVLPGERVSVLQWLGRSALTQSITLDSTVKNLEFTLYAGNGAVQLVHNGEVVRRSRVFGKQGYAMPVKWNLETYRGETVSVEILNPESSFIPPIYSNMMISSMQITR